VPSSGGIFNELVGLTRRAFVPVVVRNIYFAAPSLFMLMGSAQRSAGGLNQITIPVQGQPMVQGAWTSYAGNFNKPQVIPGVQPSQFNTAYFTVPVPLVLGEALLQSTETIVPILDVRMNDVYATTVQQLASVLFTNNSNSPLMPSGFIEAFDNGTNVATYGGINRLQSGNQFWQGNYFASTTSAPLVNSRAAWSSYLIQVTDLAGGEAPDYVIMSPSDYATLAAQFIGTETMFVRPGGAYSMDTNARSGFPNLNINGVPFYLDHWCPKGTVIMSNSKYTSMYISEDASFDFSGFYSLIPLGQLAQVGVMILGENVITSKPSTGAIFTGLTGGAF
jgi:hypothetical protein